MTSSVIYRIIVRSTNLIVKLCMMNLIHLQKALYQLQLTAFEIPEVETLAVSNDVTNHDSVTANGNIVNDGGQTITERGFVYSTNPNPTVADTKVIEGNTATGNFNKLINGLQHSTTYYIKAYAQTNIGIGYGNEISFTTGTEGVNIISGAINSWSNLGQQCSSFPVSGLAYLSLTFNGFAPTQGTVQLQTKTKQPSDSDWSLGSPVNINVTTLSSSSTKLHLYNGFCWGDNTTGLVACDFRFIRPNGTVSATYTMNISRPY